MSDFAADNPYPDTAWENPYSDMYNVGMSQELGADLAIHLDGMYIKSDKFNATNQINEARFPGGPVPFPQWGRITQVQSIGTQDYRALLDSNVADMKNVGGPYGGAITASLFLNEFTNGVPWAHLDIAGPMEADGDNGWLNRGATAFGTRLLIDTVCNFRAL